MGNAARVALMALVAFPSFTLTFYSECCTSPGGCQNPEPGPRKPCCAAKGPCCTPTIVRVQSEVREGLVDAPFAPATMEPADAVEATTPALSSAVEPAPRSDPAHRPRGPTRLFLLNCSLLR